MAQTKNNVPGSQLVQFYTNKNILITGGSGFIGKLLIQKIFRTCPDVGSIYLIIRQKKGKSPEERLTQVLENPLFDTLKNEFPDFRKKLHPISGDMEYEQLGLSDQDRQILIDQIDIVIHSAATVSFTAPLKEAVRINIRGTKELLDVCEEMKHLVAVMVVSTAFSFCPRYYIAEFFMKPPVAPETMIKMVNEIDEDTLNNLTPKLLGSWPNTYTFTKAINEDIVKSRRGKLPVGLFRPSVVMPTYEDPVKCWSDYLPGPVGLALMMSLGIIHMSYSNNSVKIDVIPGDYCVNGILATTYDVYKKYKFEDMPRKIIYNSVGTLKHSPTVAQNTNYVKENLIGFSRTMWMMFTYHTTNVVLFIIGTFFFHYLPAVILDGIALVKKEKPVFVKLYNKVTRNILIFNCFLINEWDMKRKNLDEVFNGMNSVDKNLFPFDIKTVNWDKYYTKFQWGMKKYIVKDKMDEEAIKRDQDRLRRIRMYHNIIVYGFYVLCALFVWKLFI